jgi:hypothetical protein
MALLTFADTDATAQRLVNAMTELSKQHADANPRLLAANVPEQRIAELAREVIERRSRADTFGPDAGRAGSDS